MKSLVFFVLILTALRAQGQKFDYQWPMGYGNNFDHDFGISLLDFNNEALSIAPYAEQPSFHIGSTGSFICDREGHLILMTNNCRIVDHNFQTIAGGDTLNPGSTYNNYCYDGDYPADQSALFVPELSNDSVFYLLHKDSELWPAQQDLVSKHFYLTVIVRKPDQSFYVKSTKLLLQTNMVINRLTACPNADSTKWWTWVAGYNTNTFYKFLIGGPDLVQGPEVQQIGPPLKNSELDIGIASFSGNGRMLGINNEKLGAMLYDFDNATGTFSNYRHYPYPNMDAAEGLTFAPGNRFLYLTSGRNIYQMDLENSDPEGSVAYLGSVSLPDDTGWPIGVGYMLPGPDCRIYVGPGTTTHFIHVIHKPDLKYPDCQFEINAINVPTNLSFDLPNLPMYRYLAPCDSTIGWTFPVGVLPEAGAPGFSAQVYPNPATDHIWIDATPFEYDLQFRLLDINGKVLVNNVLRESKTSLNLGSVVPGIYFWEIRDKNGHYQRGKIILASQ